MVKKTSILGGRTHIVSGTGQRLHVSYCQDEFWDVPPVFKGDAHRYMGNVCPAEWSGSTLNLNKDEGEAEGRLSKDEGQRLLQKYTAERKQELHEREEKIINKARKMALYGTTRSRFVTSTSRR